MDLGPDEHAASLQWVFWVHDDDGCAWALLEPLFPGPAVALGVWM